MEHFLKTFLKQYTLYLVIGIVIVITTFLEPLSSQWLMFDRAAIDGNGEWWRLITCHLVHLSDVHAFNNLLGLALLAYIAGPYLNNGLGVLLFVWCGLWVGVGLYLYADYLAYYVGLSGVLHGLLLVSPFMSHYYKRWVAYGFAAILIGKTIWEQTPWYNDMALADTIGGRVETNAHLFGTIAGLIFLAGYYIYQKYFALEFNK